MSRHLVDPELAADFDGPLTPAHISETLSAYRKMLEDVATAIPRRTSPALQDVHRKNRRVTGQEIAPDVRVRVDASGERGDQPLPQILRIHGARIRRDTSGLEGNRPNYAQHNATWLFAAGKINGSGGGIHQISVTRCFI